MEALVIACTAVAVILIVLWLMRWYQRRNEQRPVSSQVGGDVAIVVVVDVPQGQRASLVAALEQHLRDPIRIGAGAHRSMVPPPSASPQGRDQVVINARNGARTLDVVLDELRTRGYRVDRTEGREIVLSGSAGVEARVTVRAGGREAP